MATPIGEGPSNPYNIGGRESQYRKIGQLFLAIVDANIATKTFGAQLEGVLKRSAKLPPSLRLPHYIAPPEFSWPPLSAPTADATNKARRTISEQYRHQVADFDLYHERHHAWRKSLDRARVAIDEAQTELDAGEHSPFTKPSYLLRSAIGELGGAVVSSQIMGDDPSVNTAENLARLQDAYKRLTEWENRLRALAHQKRAPVPGDQTEQSDADWIRADSASKASGLHADTILKRAKREGWVTGKAGAMTTYKHADLKRSWPDREFRPEKGGK